MKQKLIMLVIIFSALLNQIYGGYGYGFRSENVVRSAVMFNNQLMILNVEIDINYYYGKSKKAGGIDSEEYNQKLVNAKKNILSKILEKPTLELDGLANLRKDLQKILDEEFKNVANTFAFAVAISGLYLESVEQDSIKLK